MVESFELKDDDEVTEYSRTAFRSDRYVVIVGAVRNSGRFRSRAGMTLRDFILIAGGMQDHAFLTEAEIARVPAAPESGVTARLIRVPLDSSYLFDAFGMSERSAAEVVLEPYDNVLVFRNPNWRELRSVFVGGEVRFPGRYTLQTRSERLADLIARAGGFTVEANSDGAFFSRLVDTATTLRARRIQVRRNAGALGDDSATMDDARKADTLTPERLMESVEPRIRVALDLFAAMRRPARVDNLILENGDSLHVPKSVQTVEVRGAVNERRWRTRAVGSAIMSPRWAGRPRPPWDGART